MSDHNELTPAARHYTPKLLTELARVEAHYLLRVLHEEGGRFEELADTQVPWHSMLPEDCAWADFLTEAKELLLGDADTVSEEARVERFLAYASPLFGRCFLVATQDYEGYRWFGNFRYTAEPTIGAIFLHIRNNCAPHSPFDDLPACYRSLRQLGEAASAAEPFDITQVICETWLNDLPIFLSLFPPPYRDSLEVSPPDTRTGFGWWGQFIDRSGHLHAKRVALLLQTGIFPHPRIEGRCGLAEFMRHVTSGCPD